MAGLGIHQRVPAHLQGQGGIFTAVTPQPGHKDEEDGFFFCGTENLTQGFMHEHFTTELQP